MITIPTSREAVRPAHHVIPLLAGSLVLGLVTAALAGCGDPAPRAPVDTPVRHAEVPPPDHQSPVAPTNGASDATRLVAPPAPAAPTSSANALPPLPGSSGGDIVDAPVPSGHAAVPAPARPAPPRAPTASDPNRLSGPADPDARAPAGTANEPGTTHGLVIPGPADRNDGTPPAPPAPHAQATPAPPLGSPINPPPTTSGGGDPGAAGTAP